MDASPSFDKGKNKPKQPRPIMQRPGFWLVALAVLVVLVVLIYHNTGSAVKSRNRGGELPVVLAVTRSSDVPVYINALGTVTPTNSVVIKTRINGQLDRVLFQEGQTVKAGDLLAVIDPRPYQAQLLQFQGQLARDSALLVNAKIDLHRYQKLFKEDSVAKQTLDTQASVVQQLEGTVKADQGQVANAEVNLEYCNITAPINGRVGLRQVDQGNYVQTSDPNGLVVINALNPITVVFAIPEDSVPAVLQQLNAGKTLSVQAYDRGQDKLLATGSLLTIDNQIDATTGTVKLKAQFQNDQNVLFPNQFVNVRLLVDTLHNVTVVPTAAIQHGIQGSFVYVLNADQTVSMKPITTSVVAGNDTTVLTGLLPNQSVVVEGADKLTDGAVVTVADDTASGNTPAKPKAHAHKRGGA